MTWEIIWMLIILKIPVIYLCLVVWWAVRAKPAPLEPALSRIGTEIDSGPSWQFPGRSRRRRPGPHGAPSRGYRPRAARTESGS